MDELLGMLLPILMNGGGIKDVFSALAGQGQGAARADGLSSLMARQMQTARDVRSTRTNGKFVRNAAEMLVDRLGINPYSGFGQGTTNLIEAAHSWAPDLVGTVLGVPNASSFNSIVANGAGAISEASGSGRANFLNPYSIVSQHKRAMGLADKVYGMGVNDDGGFNVSFGHGLNMNEMGLTTQRLLSSRLAYRQYGKDENGDIDVSKETGKQLDPIKDAEEFDANIKKFGSEFNKTVSSLSKITGSVEEAISLMDRLGGGDFLGGSAEQASNVARKAQHLATAVRVTSAMSGVSPQETYQNMMLSQNAMLGGFGINPVIARASGFANTMGHTAFSTAMAFNGWAAANPNATQEQREQAALGLNAMGANFEKSNAAQFGNLVTAHKELFDEDELEEIKMAFRSGDPTKVRDMVRNRIGKESYDLYMNTEEGRTTARMMAEKKDSKLNNEIKDAGLEGYRKQANTKGAKRLHRAVMGDVNRQMDDAAGKYYFSNGQKAQRKSELVKMAEENGISKEKAEKMSLGELRTALENVDGVSEDDIDKRERKADVDFARKDVNSRTLSESGETMARAKLREEIGNSSGLTDDKKSELIKELDSGGDLDKVFVKFSGRMDDKTQKRLKKEIYGGKISRKTAGRMMGRLKELDHADDRGITSSERLDFIEKKMKTRFSSTLGLRQKGQNWESFKGKVDDLRDQGIVVTEDDDDLGETITTASRGMVDDLFGERLGGLEGNPLDYLKREISDKVTKGVESGKSVQEAFADATAFVGDNDEQFDKKGTRVKLDKEARETLRKFRKDLSNDKSDTSRKVSNDALISRAASILDQSSEKGRKDKIKEMRELASGKLADGMSGQDAVNRFAELGKELGAFNDNNGKFDAKKFSRLRNSSLSTYGDNGDFQAAIGELLVGMSPDFLRNHADTSALAAGSAELALTNWALGESGADLGLGVERSISESAGNALTGLDDDAADRSMNRFPNMLKGGETKYFQDAVDQSKKELKNLRAALYGKDESGKDILGPSGKKITMGLDPRLVETAFGGGSGSEEALAAVQRKLEYNDATKENVGHYMNLLSELHEKRIGTEDTQGGVKGLKVLESGDLNKIGVRDDEKKDMVGILKGANFKDAQPVTGIVEGVGDLMKFIAPFFSDPGKFFRTPVPVYSMSAG